MYLNGDQVEWDRVRNGLRKKKKKQDVTKVDLFRRIGDLPTLKLIP